MKKIKIKYGFKPNETREYNGEYIQRVVETRRTIKVTDANGIVSEEPEYYKVSSGCWIHNLGFDKYTTDWSNEEKWGRVEEIEFDENGNELSSKDLGFMIMRVDRNAGKL